MDANAANWIYRELVALVRFSPVAAGAVQVAARMP
jgi:hypothetical protein